LLSENFNQQIGDFLKERVRRAQREIRRKRKSASKNEPR
jgi:hypothetical protein